ncbi:hypothetical protein [Methylomonas sp. 11b]|uniref:hypothetical protein n=1 Tax=Methylomonas sp. 11b TaxID=1168169 RepID=UPI000479502F|nr:hypothetical protein [Methylomonas sp. 11b]
MASTKTIEQFMAELEARGETVVEWAEKHEFPAWAVYRLTAGLNKGKRGQAHRIAVAMGIKADPNQQAA